MQLLSKVRRAARTHHTDSSRSLSETSKSLHRLCESQCAQSGDSGSQQSHYTDSDEHGECDGRVLVDAAAAKEATVAEAIICQDNASLSVL